MSDTPSNGIPYVPEGTLDPAAGLNLALAVVDALLNTRVEDMAHTAPPGTAPADGAAYIVASPATGAWAGREKDLAVYDAASATWTFYDAGVEAWLLLNKADSNLYRWNAGTSAWELAAGIGEAPIDGNFYGRKNAAWAVVPGLTNPVLSVDSVLPDSSGDIPLDAADIPFASTSAAGITATNVGGAINEVAARAAPLQSIVAACSDETTALTAGTGKVTFRNPYASAFTITKVKASLTTAQGAGSIFTVDIKESGVSLLSTKITIDNTEKTSETAATPPVLSDTSIAADAELTVDITQIGDGTAKGLKVYIVGHL